MLCIWTRVSERLISHIQCHPSIWRRVSSLSVASSSGSLSRCCVCVCVCVSVPGRAARVMAAAPANPRTGSTRAQLSPCYFEGYLEKRGAKEKVSGHYDMSYTWSDYINTRSGVSYMAYTARAHCVDMGEVCMDQLSEYYFVCQVTTQILIVDFYCNVNGWMSRRFSVSCVMPLYGSSLNLITHMWALIFVCWCFKFSAASQLLW